jgi:ribosomal protein S27AE
MADAEKIKIKGKQLKCPFCGNGQFFVFDVKLNTLSTTFFSGVWSLLAKKAKAYACSNCGLKQEFVSK